MSPYQTGEVAGFPETEARRLIEAGVAEEYVVRAETGPPADKMIHAPKRKK